MLGGAKGGAKEGTKEGAERDAKGGAERDTKGGAERGAKGGAKGGAEEGWFVVPKGSTLSLIGLTVPNSPSIRESLIGFFNSRLEFIGPIASITLIKAVLVIALFEGI